MIPKVITLLGFYKSPNIIVVDTEIVPVSPYKHLDYLEFVGKQCFFQLKNNGRFKTIMNIVPIDV